MAMVEQYGGQIQKAARAQRDASLRTAHALAQNFATLVSGVLIGMTEAMQQGAAKSPPAKKKR
jgi:hypothetical protein